MFSMIHEYELLLDMQFINQNSNFELHLSYEKYDFEL